MSLTSYRAAPPRVGGLFWVEGGGRGDCGPGGDLLFRTLRCSTIGAEGFHGRVRDGIGCLAPRHGHQACPRAGGGRQSRPRATCPWQGTGGGDLSCEKEEVSGEAASGVLPLHAGGPPLLRGQGRLGSSTNRAISTGQLRGLPRFHLRPIDVVVFHGSRRDLVLRRVSRLDAFSGYPVRT